MAPKNTIPTIEIPEGDEKAYFVGEEGDDRSTPGKDLAASIVIAVLGVAAIIAAFQWKVPATIFTAPAVLPVIVGLSLIGMAFGLGVRAVRMGAMKTFALGPRQWLRGYMEDEENPRTFLLFGIVFIYVLLVINLGFELSYKTSFFTFRFTSYEFFSGVILTWILKVFWRASLGRCLLVAFAWSIILAATFRYGFSILLPGTG